jgi:hypothetical protein
MMKGLHSAHLEFYFRAYELRTIHESNFDFESLYEQIYENIREFVDDYMSNETEKLDSKLSILYPVSVAFDFCFLFLFFYVLYRIILSMLHSYNAELYLLQSLACGTDITILRKIKSIIDGV